MFSKIYEKIKKYIIKNHNFLLFLILLTIILNIKVPYVVNAPGGIIPLSNRVTIDGNKINSNYYTTYVSVMEGKVASLLASLIIPNWDLETYEKYSGESNLSYKELNKVEKLMMKEGNNNAVILAFNKAGVEYKIKNNKLTVFYKLEDYDNDLNIGDIITKCNDKTVNNFDELTNCIKSSENEVKLDILRNGKNKKIEAPLYEFDGNKVIGVRILSDFDIESKFNVDINSSSSESGSSGGFMTALSIYDYITNGNFSNNLKIAGTGTIDQEGKVGKIAGIKYKLLGANKKNVDIFFCPDENYIEAVKIKNKHHLKLKIIKIKTFDDAINYLNNLKK